jgi:hypothetical protein
MELQIMALKTYLETVNDVLIRLREPEVTSVNDTAYSKLISKYVVDAQRQVEDSYNWNALSNTLTMNTVPNLFNAVLVGSGVRFRLIDVIDDTNNRVLKYRSSKEMNDLFLNQEQKKGPPEYFNFNGVSPEGDTQVDLYPIPDAVYTVRFNIIQPQDPLQFDSDKLLVPAEPVIFLAYAKALAERGEDGGMSTSEAYQLFQQSLADHISNESNLFEEEFIWASR